MLRARAGQGRAGDPLLQPTHPSGGHWAGSAGHSWADVSREAGQSRLEEPGRGTGQGSRAKEPGRGAGQNRETSLRPEGSGCQPTLSFASLSSLYPPSNRRQLISLSFSS